MQTTDPQDELFPIVNEKDEVIGKITRKEAHVSPNIIHRAVHLSIFDQQGRLLLQKRSMTKDTAPGCWCNSVTGHVDYGEDYLPVAVRETQEELGISIDPHALLPLGKMIVVAPWEKEMTQVYKLILTRDVIFNPNPEEITEIRFVDLKSLSEMLESEKWTPSSEQVLKRFILQ